MLDRILGGLEVREVTLGTCVQHLKTGLIGCTNAELGVDNGIGVDIGGKRSLCLEVVPFSVRKEIEVACTCVPLAIEMEVGSQTVLVLEDTLQTETLEVTLQACLLPGKGHKGIILVVLQELIRGALNITGIGEGYVATGIGYDILLLLVEGVGNLAFALELLVLESVFAPSAEEPVLIEGTRGLRTQTEAEALDPVTTKGREEGTDVHLAGAIGIGTCLEVVVEEYLHTIEHSTNGRTVGEPTLQVIDMHHAMRERIRAVNRPEVLVAVLGTLLELLVAKEVDDIVGEGLVADIGIPGVMLDVHLVQLLGQ